MFVECVSFVCSLPYRKVHLFVECVSFVCSLPYSKVHLFSDTDQRMHSCEDVQLYSFIRYTDMFRPLL